MSDINTILNKQKAFFSTGNTRTTAFRKEQLVNLRNAVKKNEDRIFSALQKDLGKSNYESYLTEVGLLLEEIGYTLKHIRSWIKPRRVRTPILHFPASSRIIPEPYGVALIIAPWNYPFQLALAPLVGAIAAGNCAVIKPSEYSKHTSRLMAELIRDIFEPDYITVVEGDAEVNQALLKEDFDTIFFTGSVPVGKIVMAEAARNLTPVTLELGGKSPVIVDENVNLQLSARRIASGKFINAGQTCIAPDYLMVHEKIKDKFVQLFKEQLDRFFGGTPQTHSDYPRIISDRHFERLVDFLDNGTIIHGGEHNAGNRYIAPTLLENVSWEDPVMQEEIFGPVLPVLTYNDVSEVVQAVNSRPKPLALYLFTNNRAIQKRVLSEVSYGGGCVNDTLIHLATPHLPFGGVGESGMGNYHGKASFDAFTHYKSVLTNSFLFDNPFRYPPYGNKLGLVKRVFG